MAEEIEIQEKCLECGSDIRDNTQFCYNCGKSLVIETVPDTVINESNSEELVQSPIVDDAAEKRASAALERKRSRQGQRRPTKIVWEEPGAAANRLYLLVCILIFIVAAALVFVTTILK